MTDHSPLFGHPADPRLFAAADVGVKLSSTIDAVARVAGADVVLVGAVDGRAGATSWPKGLELAHDLAVVGLGDRLSEIGARVTRAERGAGSLSLPDGSVDVVVGAWTVYRGVDPRELSEADRVLRPHGRLVVIHDYGRDDLSLVAGVDRPEIASWSRRGGPFFSAGFKIRVVHCWLTFESMEAATEVLEATFGPRGVVLAGSLKRPRISYNLAVYHRTRPAP